MHLTHAERLLQELGITEPDEIDLDAIAFHVGARVRYRPLEGCEARIIGAGDQAIITVKVDSHPRRKRFSIAHELGHWHHHRGQCLVCRAEEMRPGGALSPERVADGFAAHLLMPAYLFKPLARQHGRLTFKAVNALAEAFRTSQTATAIRLVESDHAPALLICHGAKGRKWFTRAPSVPQRWFPQEALDADSFAFGVLFGSKPDDPMPRKIGADAWFDRRDAERFEVHEQTRRTGTDEVLTLILVSDPDMLEDQGYRR
ncbi:ImmA/IrrE family metallo-endopeptidase [Tistrella sp. BH-R2-4]|uniref:ImmA/IrrE family metallo-endopeptidase n=1 Tax=Tistrella arctica TaxID=3133430 RepID=A0ABU9YKZ0_9PROT